MKKIGLLALLVGAALFLGLGATSAMAEEGKCGSSKPAKCGAEKKDGNESAGKCGSEKKEKAVTGKCGK